MNRSKRRLVYRVSHVFSEFTCKMAGVPASALLTSQWEVSERAQAVKARQLSKN